MKCLVYFALLITRMLRGGSFPFVIVKRSFVRYGPLLFIERKARSSIGSGGLIEEHVRIRRKVLKLTNHSAKRGDKKKVLLLHMHVHTQSLLYRVTGERHPATASPSFQGTFPDIGDAQKYACDSAEGECQSIQISSPNTAAIV